MRILWAGVSPIAASGYGVASKNILPRLKAAGHDVWCFSFYSVPGQNYTWQGIPILPIHKQQFGSDIVTGYIQRYQIDLVTMLFDQWPICAWQDLGDIYVPQVVLHYRPMELPLKEAVEKLPMRIALCEWAKSVMADEGLPSVVIPLGVDTKVYRPIWGTLDDAGNLITQESCKAHWNIPPDKFVVGMVQANRDFRKNLEGQLTVFREFHERNPDTILLFHTNPNANEGGWDLPRLLHFLELDTAPGRDGCVYMTDAWAQDLNEGEMTVLYSAMDVLLQCSMSEGFGVPIIEAAACGTPAIVSDFSAMPEVAGLHAWKVGGDLRPTPMYSFGLLADPEWMLRALEESLTEAKNRRGAAREHALGYDYDKIVKERWLPFLKEWQENREL